MSRIVVFFYEFFKAKKALFYVVLLSLFLVFGYFASRITLQEDITKMIPDDKTTKDYKTAIQEIRILDKIIVSISADSAGMEDSLIACAEQFVQKVNDQPASASLISEVRFKIEEDRLAGVYNLLYNNLPVYLAPEDYKRIDSITTDSAIAESVQRGYHKLISPASFVLKEFVLKDPLSISASALGKLQGMQAEDSYELYNGCIFRKDRKTLVIFLTPTHPANKTGLNGPLIDLLNTARDSSEAQFTTFNVDYFGAAAVAVSNARQIERDIKVIATAALVLILVFLYIFYRSWSLPILMLSPIAFGGIFSLSMVYFIQGSISAIAIGAGSVIIGIALDYSFHVFAHYKHTRSIHAVVNDIATPMMIGSISTVGAFFSLLYVHSDILSDFGLFAGLCLIGASLFSLLFLPHLIETFNPVKASDDEHTAEPAIMKFIHIKPEMSKWFVIIVGILTAVFVYFSNRVSFDSDLSKINYMSEELKAAENKLYQNDTSAGKSIFMIFKGKTISDALYKNEEALVIIDSLKKKELVHRYAGISALLPSDSIQKQRIALWHAYWTPEKIARIEQSVSKHAVALGFKAEAFNPFFELLKKQYAPMNEEDKTFMKDVFLKDYIQSDSNGVAVLASMRLPLTVTSDIYKPFERVEGLTILDRQLFYNKFLLIVKDDFNQILLSSSLLVFAILLISYGRIELSLISFLPMVISWFWILGLMGIFDIHFNIVNIIISTFVFGLGDDYSIFSTDGLQKKYAEGKDNLSSYKISIFLSAFTTIVAMGALIFAKHPALRSIALISIIGITCVVIISYTIIPLLFRWMITNRTEQGKAPLTLLLLVRLLLIIVWQIVILVFLSLVRIICIVGSFSGKQSSRRFYKTIVCYASKCVLFFSFFLSKKIPALPVDLSKRPLFIIVGSNSVLDYLVLLSLHPRIVLISSKNKSTGWLKSIMIFMSDIYNGEERESGSTAYYLNAYIHEGFSPVFMLTDPVLQQISNETTVDVLPIHVTGTALSLAENDYIFNRAWVTVHYLPFISDAKQHLAEQFVSASSQLNESLPTKEYFNHILSGYIYKGPVLEWYFRIKVQLEQSYQVFNDLLPMQGKIYDLGCGYGFLDYFLQEKSSARKIIGVDYDEEKISVANHSYLKTDRLTFRNQDVMEVQIEHADAVVILDVLHYLSVENQCKLIRSAFQGLRTGGILIIRDGDCSQESKHNGTKLTEFFSTRLLKFNKQTEENLCFMSSQKIIEILQDFNVEVKLVDTTIYTSNVMYYVIKP